MGDAAMEARGMSRARKAHFESGDIGVRMLVLHKQGLTCIEIAARLQIAVSSVYNRLPALKRSAGIEVKGSGAPPTGLWDVPEIKPERMAYGTAPLPANCTLARRILGLPA